MAESKVELRKLRDFGENFNDTFSFIRQNGKQLVKAFFSICGIFLLIHAIFNGIYQSRNFGFLDRIRNIGTNPVSTDTDVPSIFSPEYFMVLIFGLLAYAAIITTAGAYIKHYDQNNGEKPSVDQVWQNFKRYFLKIFIYSLPVDILIVISVFFCCFPFFYFATILAPFPIVVMMEDLSFGDAFSRCFIIIKNNFWISLAIYLVAAMIYYISSALIGFIVGLVVGLASYFTTKDIGTTVGIVTSILNIFSSLFSLILIISISLNYFNLVEQFDGTGIMRRIENLGITENNNFDNIEQRY